MATTRTAVACMRVCPDCQVRKINSAFVKNRSRPDGLGTYCKECNTKRSRHSARKHPEKVDGSARRHLLRRYYGITPEIYQELLDKQNGNCAICNRHHSHFKIRLAVEHSHATGEIRGLCCSYCNRGLSAYHDKPEYFRAAAAYLEQGTGLFVPEDRPKRRRRRKHK